MVALFAVVLLLLFPSSTSFLVLPHPKSKSSLTIWRQIRCSRPTIAALPILRASSSSDASEDATMSDADVSFLLQQVSSLRSRRAEEDQLYARNWKLGIFHPVQLVESDNDITPVRMNGDMLAFCTEAGGIYIVELSSGDLVCAFQGHDDLVSSLHFDGEIVITGGKDGLVLVNKFRMMSGGILFAEDDEDDEDNGDVDDDDEYETMGISAADEELRIQAHDGIVTGIARIDRHAFVTSCINGQIKSWGLSDGSVRWSIQAQWQVRCLAAADGYVVAGFSDGSVVVYEAEEGQEILSFKAHNGGVTCIDFPNKAWLVTGGSDGEVKYWDLEEGGEPQQGTFHVDGRDIQHRFEGHDAPVVALQSSETKVVSAASDGVVRVHDIRMGIELFRIEGYSPNISSVQFNEKFLVTDGTYQTIVCHDFSGSGEQGDEEDDEDE